MRANVVRTNILITLVASLAAGCSLLVPGPGERTPRSDGGVDAQAPAPDSGADAGVPSDAGADASGDAAAADAGVCSVACEEPTPFCDPVRDTCVQCLDHADCDDGDHCTVDRCSFGTCTNNEEPRCVRQVAVGDLHACARLASGQVRCWGWNVHGQIGNGSKEQIATMPASVSGITDAVEIAAGVGYTCARLSTGSVRCWGRNHYGQLGDGSWTEQRTPVEVMGIDDAVQLAAGGLHTCAVRSGGTVACWGYNHFGQLGDGTTTDRYVPVPVVDLTGVTTVAAGSFHTCGTDAAGSVYCWGHNDSGQLGDGTTTSRATPGPVVDLTGAVSVKLGGSHSCALLGSGSVQCWGYNSFGQLGNGSTANSAEPVDVLGLSNVVELAAAGLDFFTCARTSTGSVYCWGYNDYGQLGDGSTAHSPLPVPVVDLDDAVHIAAGGATACAVRASGAVVCWGRNNTGQLGDGTTMNSSVPVEVRGL